MFRIEAVEAQKRKLHGDVFLAQPISFRIITYLIVSIIFFTVFFLTSGTFARSEKVAGYLTPSYGLIKIQASQFGTLTALHVEEGDTITEGQTLLNIRTSKTTLDGFSSIQRNIEILAEQQEATRYQIALERNQLDAELAKLLSEKAEFQLGIQSLDKQIALQQQITLSAQAAYEDVQEILEKGFISKIESERRRQTWLAQQTQEQLKQQELVEAKARLKQLDIRLRQLPDESQQRVARLESQLAELKARIVEQEGLQSYVIEAPVSGRIVSINSGSVGRTVQAGQSLLSIMPEGSTLDAELFVPSRAAGFIEEGQEVRLLYDAFPYQRFGSYGAQITQVTQTILPPGETQAPFPIQEPVYRVTARLNAQEIMARGQSVSLQSGMTLQANIILEKRSFLDWFLDPLKANGGFSRQN